MSELDVVTKTLTFATKSASDGTFTGVASSWELDSDNEQMIKGCWSDALKDGPVPLLWQHDRQAVCGWVFKAAEDSNGLLVSAKCLLDAEIGRTAFAMIKEGLELGARPNLSVGFRVVKEQVIKGVRSFLKCILMELSVVTWGACPGAVVLSAKHRTISQPEREPDPLLSMATKTIHDLYGVESEIDGLLRRIG